jgi:type I restriction enzyme S subunit
MQSPAVQEQLHARSTGTTVLGIKQRELRKIMLQLPPLSEQKAIARILGSLDEKIELNRRMNETLEGIADALFESWFVDFDPVRAKSENREVGFPKGITAMFPDTLEDSEIGEIPSGWQTRRIDELATINGLMLRKEDPLETVEYIEISEVLKGEIAKVSHFDRGQEPSRARRRLRHGDTVLSTVRPDRKSFFLCLNPPPNLIASTGFAVISPVEAPWSWIHAALTRDEVFSQLGRHADGGAYPAVRPEILGSYQTCWPSRKEPPELFHRLAAPLYEQAQRNRAESKTLTALRDSLLPRLFSGELRVATILRAGASAT